MNPHGIAPTSTSSYRVYLFRHSDVAPANPAASKHIALACRGPVPPRAVSGRYAVTRPFPGRPRLCEPA